MLKTKKIIGLIALASVLISGVAFAAPGCGDTACGAPIPQLEVEAPAEEGISISGGFSKLWKQTGIYRFVHPKTAEEKKAEKLNAATARVTWTKWKPTPAWPPNSEPTKQP